jgi:FKBP-type peptidyl-prolyl cis-trans isomerase
VYFKTSKNYNEAQDSSGIFWLASIPLYYKDTKKMGEKQVISYTGSLLNGFVIDQSPPDFEYVPSSPDQLIKGLNLAFKKLKIGETAKIILPSRLAFGKNGTGNSLVPPFTPLLYEIKINDIKK